MGSSHASYFGTTPYVRNSRRFNSQATLVSLRIRRVSPSWFDIADFWGDVGRVASIHDLNALANLEEITGSLALCNNSGIVDADGMSSLRYVGGTV